GGNVSSLTTINQYLSSHYQDTISSILYQGLLQCGTLPYPTNCHYGPDTCGTDKQGHPYYCPHCDTLYVLHLVSPQPLPIYLTCGFNDSSYTCLNCTNFKKLDTAFYAIFHRHPLFTGTLSDSDIIYNNLFAQYVN